MHNQTLRVELDPSRFYSLTSIIQSITPERRDSIVALERDLRTASEDIEKRYKILLSVEARIAFEGRAASRKIKPFDDLGSQERDFGDMLRTSRGQTYIHMLHTILEEFKFAYDATAQVVSSIKPSHLILTTKKHSNIADSYQDLQHMMYEFQLNEPTINKFINAVQSLELLKEQALNSIRRIINELDGYHGMLINRHSVEGIDIHVNPVATDIALTVYENIDSHGEVADGKKSSEVSAYTINKALALVDAIKNLSLNELIRDSDILTNLIIDNYDSLWSMITLVQTSLEDVINKTMMTLGMNRRQQPSKQELDHMLTTVEDLNPKNVQQHKKETILSREEKFNLQFKNETLKELATMLLKSNVESNNVVFYVLDRKAHLRQFFQEENSFYVCKIGQGNPFTYESPGTLSVIPGPRPLAEMSNIKGQGFDEVKSFFAQVEASAAWHDIFVATSPSKSADKSNVLLIGPQGCGKTEVLRAVGSDKKSIGIFAQASDFLTCWKGEAEKNPKRLFEAGVKLQRESKRHVHFLIDEIDAVLNNERGFGSTNLTLEFQILMDGVVQYPHLSVWGTTNVPERIPMPMIRRFNKVLIVGELNQQDRVDLLKIYVDGFMPTRNFNDKIWNDQALRLEGATGDVMRKIADHLWREKMSLFVKSRPEVAKGIIEWLNTSQKFQVAEFSLTDRLKLKQLLLEYIAITPDDLGKSISIHLDNVAIRSEIQTAIATYENAKKFISQIKS